MKKFCAVAVLCISSMTGVNAYAQEAASKAFIDGQGPGWVDLTEKDFERVNLEDNTWMWEGTLAKCTGKP